MSSPRKGGVDRRRLLSLGGTALAASTLAAGLPPAAAAADAKAGPPDPTYATIVEGTNIAVAPSPDGKIILFDLFGILWTVPMAGGVATRLTDDFADAAMPDWAPDGKTIVFQSYKSGNFHIWTANADGTAMRQLTTGYFDCREPKLSPDGRKLAYASDATGEYAIHVMDLATGRSKVWARNLGQQSCQPAWSPDGTRIVYAVDRNRIEICDAKGKKTAGAKMAQATGDPMAAMMNPGLLQSPAFTPDGKGVVYHAVENGAAEYRGAGGALFQGEDLFPFRPVWLKDGDLLYTADGKIKRRAGAKVTVIEFACSVPVARPAYRKKARDYDGKGRKPVVGIGSPALSPDGEKVAFRALNALYVMPIGGAPKAVVDDGYWVCDPAWSPDGGTLAFSTDRAGKLDIWLRDMATGAERQLTRFKDAAVSSAWSKDGKQIAFLSQTGALNRVDVESGVVTQVFGPLWEPGKPSWSADGKTIAYAAFKPYSARFREGLSEILTVDVATGAATYQPVFPDRSFGTRGDDGPFWSADGKTMLFVFASRLYVADVDPKGRMLGPPKLINDELTDAPTWDATASKVLYLSGGKLRMTSAKGGAPKTIPHQLTWAIAKPKEKLIVRAGQVWQGLGPEMLTKVDIVCEDGWIKDIVPAGQAKIGEAKLIDASDATVIPGLVEMHAHRQMQGYGYGDRDGRLWLSLGVTTARSPGSPAYHMVEDREALDAGLRVGPRYFSTGEAIDGGRTYYNFMRPVSEPGQMALELERARALGYDMMKSYVRLPLALQKELIDWAHTQGMHVSGHYHYPAMHFGQDGMEHIGATSRLGYSRTVTALGASYQDVTAVFVQSGARRTPTLFQSSVLHGEDRSLVDDRRTRALYPPWEYAKLTARAEQAAKGDNAVVMRALQKSVEHVKAIVRNGGRITAGTDSPIDLNGVSLHMNLRAMVMFGMTPYETLVTATRYAGEYLDQPFGVLAPGMLADMVVSNGDPLADIKAAADVRYTIKNGEVFDIPTLVAPFEGKAQPAAGAAAPVRLARADDRHWWHTADYVEEGRAACCVDPLCRPSPRGVRRTFMAVEV